MLKAADHAVSQKQPSKAAKENQPKAQGSTISLLKATSKVLAFLNPAGRKSNSSNGPDHEGRTPEYPPLDPNLLFSQTTASSAASRRGPQHDASTDSSTVEQYKYLFRNRPLNNSNPQLQQPQQHQTSHQTKTKEYTRSESSTQQSLSASNSTFQDSASVYRAQKQHHELTGNINYKNQEKLLAKEQLRIVRRNLRECSPDSMYFKRFAPIADDWRNFLPSRGMEDEEESDDDEVEGRPIENNPCIAQDGLFTAWCGVQDYHIYDARLENGDDSEYEYSLDEIGNTKDVFESPATGNEHLSMKTTYTSTRRLPASPSSTSSSVKELLREEEPCQLISSTSLDATSLRNASEVHHGLSADIAEKDTGMESGRSCIPRCICNSDDTEANFADADERSIDSISEREMVPRRARGPKTDGARTKKPRRRTRKPGAEKQVSMEQQLKVEGQSKGRRVRSNDIRRLDVTYSGGERRCNGRHKSSGSNGNIYTQQSQEQEKFHETRLEDIVKCIESEFFLSLDNCDEEESEDSLTYLVSGHENSGDDLPEESDMKIVARRTQGLYPTSHPISVSQSYEESASPSSTLLNSSSDFRVDAPSLIMDDMVREKPPLYGLHKQDQQLYPPATSMSLQTQQAIKSASAAALAETMGYVQKEDEAHDKMNVKTTDCKNHSSSRPSLTLQTMVHTLGGIAPGALSAFENRPLVSQFSLTKCNSTSSLYIDSTMAKSDVDGTLRAVARVLYDKVLESHQKNDCRTERIVNSSSYVPSMSVVMTQADIFEFMRFIFDCGQNLGAENAVITLIYVERMTELGNLSFHAINWRRLLLGALILSIKVWEDLAVFNSDVCAIFEGLSVKDVNALERFTMAKLQYNVSVKRSLYAAYYFRLRDVSEQEHNEHYGKLTLSMSQRDMQGESQTTITATDSCVNRPRQQRFGSSSRRGSSTTMGVGVGNAQGMMGSGSSGLAGTHHSKVPIGPGYRKWTLKPLSVREADRLEARSSLYSSNTMMEEHERKDAGCCLDEYSTATPEELQNLSVTLLAASMRTIPSMASMSTVVGSMTGQSNSYINNGSIKTMSTSSSISSTATKVAGSAADLASKEDGGDNDGAQTVDQPRRTLRLKKSRSDFFFQNTTPASIM